MFFQAYVVHEKIRAHYVYSNEIFPFSIQEQYFQGAKEIPFRLFFSR